MAASSRAPRQIALLWTADWSAPIGWEMEVKGTRSVVFKEQKGVALQRGHFQGTCCKLLLGIFSGSLLVPRSSHFYSLYKVFQHLPLKGSNVKVGKEDHSLLLCRG